MAYFYKGSYETLARVAEALKKAWRDKAYKQRLIQDPAFVRNELKTIGVSLPKDIKIKVVAMDPGTYYVIIPPAPRQHKLFFSDVSVEAKAQQDAVHIQLLEAAGL